MVVSRSSQWKLPWSAYHLTISHICIAFLLYLSHSVPFLYHITEVGIFGKCPNWTSPNYWGYNLQQILEGDVQNHQKGTFTNPCFITQIRSDSSHLDPWTKGLKHHPFPTGRGIAGLGREGPFFRRHRRVPRKTGFHHEKCGKMWLEPWKVWISGWFTFWLLNIAMGNGP